MNAICKRPMTKARVVNETIELYRGVYARMQQYPDVLRAVRNGSRCGCFSADASVGCAEVCSWWNGLRT